MWVSCIQHICRSYFLIHSATLCLLIGAFNPSTFKVIIDRYLFIDIFSRCSCVPLSLSLTLFLPFLKAVPLSYLAVLVWWRYIFSTFFCLRNSSFAFHFKWELLDSLGYSLCFSLLGIFPAIPFWLLVFMLRNQLPALLEFPCMSLPISPLLPLSFSFCLCILLF